MTSARKILLFIMILFLIQNVHSDESRKILKMGYRTNSKLPYIGEDPDNSGLYFDIFSEAARRIGYKLEIVRLPKLRVLQSLEDGSVDFYPGFSFDMERAEYSHWFINGIVQRNIIISKDDMREFQEPSDMEGLTHLKALGNPDYLKDFSLSHIDEIVLPELDVPRAVQLILSDKADFYIYEEDTLKYYIKANKIEGIRFHDKILKGESLSHVGFSRNSPLYEGLTNPDFREEQTMNRQNFPFILKEGSVVDEFRDALLDLYEEGFIERLYSEYFD